VSGFDAIYCYPGTHILINRLGLLDADQLDLVERRIVVQRLAEGPPSGDFDLAHLRAIHRHLFQDIYDWAGELREVEIAKGGHGFMPRRFIATGMFDVHDRIVRADGLRGLDAEGFARAAGEIIGDVNHIHPFREGNGRTQIEYLRQLAARGGHAIDVRRLNGERWYAASRAAHLADYAPMAAAIGTAIVSPRPDRP